MLSFVLKVGGITLGAESLLLLLLWYFRDIPVDPFICMLILISSPFIYLMGKAAKR